MAHWPKLVPLFPEKSLGIGDTVLKTVSELNITLEPTAVNEIKPTLLNLVLNGTARQSKHSIKLLWKLVPDKSDFIKKLISQFIPQMNKGNEYLSTHLAALSNIAMLSPEIFSSYKDEIFDFIIRTVLGGNALFYKDKKDKKHESDYHGLKKFLSKSVEVKKSRNACINKLFRGISNRFRRGIKITRR